MADPGGKHEAKRAAMANNLAATTGRDLDQWVQLVADADVAGFSAVVAWLKQAHRLGHFQARRIAEEVRDRAS